MSDRKARLTITVDPHLSAYAEHLVESGKAPSVSAASNQALEERAARDRRRRRLWREAAERADPAKVTRMKAHIDTQLAQLGG
jgi:Arc/MetJ-type ribon-helix-helix transcriptional regulator